MKEGPSSSQIIRAMEAKRYAVFWDASGHDLTLSEFVLHTYTYTLLEESDLEVLI
jgi:hypothetical protein